MLTTPERRHSERARIPCHIPVELTDAARAAQFEADAVDLSVGGLSLRAAQLPDVGSQLFCTFEAMPGGAQILGRGEVVWRQPTGDNGGEFGLRFIEVDARNQALIDEMVAEGIARIAPRPKPHAPEPIIASLEIENVEEPVSARVVHASESHVLFEQQLAHFAVGKAVMAHAGPSLVQGHVASVEIRMEGTTPRLLVNVELARDASQFGEFMWGEPGSDTDPDLFAQAEAQDSSSSAHGAPLEARDELLPPALEDDDSDADSNADSDLDDVEDAQDVAADGNVGTLAGIGAPAHGPAPILARTDAEARQLPLFRRDHQHRQTAPELGGLHLNAQDSAEPASYVPDDVHVDEDRAKELIEAYEAGESVPTDDEASLEEVHAVSLAAAKQYAASEREEEAEPPPDGALMRVLGVFAMLTEGFRRVSERARELTDSGAREDSGTRTASAGRGLFSPKTRRVTSSTQRDPAERSRNLRAIVIGTLAIMTVVAFAYVLSLKSDEPIPHQDVRAGQTGADGEASAQTETSEAAALSAPSGQEAAPESAGSTTAADKASQPRSGATGADKASKVAGSAPPAGAGNKPSSLASAKPSAAVGGAKPAVAASGAKPAAAGGSMVFGEKQVPNARRFLLRMAEPVRTILGTRDRDGSGFSVVIMGNKALDRAAPIAAGHPAVEQAAILNRRDNSAELTVRFAPGKTPAYRVSGQGSTLEVLLEQ